MTTPLPGPGTPAPQPPRPDKRALRWPDVSTPWGAVLYAIIAGLVVSIVLDIMSHVQVVISWR